LLLYHRLLLLISHWLLLSDCLLLHHLLTHHRSLSIHHSLAWNHHLLVWHDLIRSLESRLGISVSHLVSRHDWHSILGRNVHINRSGYHHSLLICICLKTRCYHLTLLYLLNFSLLCVVSHTF
jgi:hypothetical protein